MPPRTESIDALANSKRDYQQLREELSLQYYGCDFKRLTKAKKHKVSAWVRNRRGRAVTRKERYQMPIHEELKDYYERTYREDENSMIRRIDETSTILRDDLRSAIDSACEAFPRPVVLAACELMTVEQASVACHQRKQEICTRVGQARTLLRQLLAEYRAEE